ITAGDPGSNDQFITGITGAQVVHFHTTNGHGTTELLVGFPAKAQLFHMTPADIFQPAQINLIVGVPQTVDIIRQNPDRSSEGIRQIPGEISHDGWAPIFNNSAGSSPGTWVTRSKPDPTMTGVG